MWLKTFAVYKDPQCCLLRFGHQLLVDKQLGANMQVLDKAGSRSPHVHAYDVARVSDASDKVLVAFALKARPGFADSVSIQLSDAGLLQYKSQCSGRACPLSPAFELKTT